MKRSVFFLIFFLYLASHTNAQYRVTPNKPYSILKSNPGWMSITELNGGFGLHTNSTADSKSFIGFTTIAGYQLNSSFMAGAGVGLSFYDTDLLIPLFLDFRYFFLPRQLSPFIYADGGLLLKVSDMNGSKLFINPGAGVRYSFGRKLAATGSIGILSQMDGDNRASFLSFKAGITYVF